MLSRPVSVPHLHRMMADPPAARPVGAALGDVDAASIAAGHHDRELWSLGSHSSESVRAAADARIKVLQCRR